MANYAYVLQHFNQDGSANSAPQVFLFQDKAEGALLDAKRTELSDAWVHPDDVGVPRGVYNDSEWSDITEDLALFWSEADDQDINEAYANYAEPDGGWRLTEAQLMDAIV